MSTWRRDHADYHMGILLSADGPIRGSDAQNTKGAPLCCEPPPLHLFDDRDHGRPRGQPVDIRSSAVDAGATTATRGRRDPVRFDRLEPGAGGARVSGRARRQLRLKLHVRAEVADELREVV